MRALNVDDKDDNLYFLETVLRSAGFDVVNAHHGGEALDILREHSFDLIVSDVLMPQMDGFQFCHEVRKNPAWSKIPFVFYTGIYTDNEDANLALRLGATRYLIKPMEAMELASILKEIASTPCTEAAPAEPRVDDQDYLRLHSARLKRKLEEKAEQFEQLSRKLQAVTDERARDLAERQSVENALRRNEERYKAVVGCMAEGILLVDHSCQVVACNDSAARILRLSKEKILVSNLSRPEWIMINEDGNPLAAVQHPLRQCLENGTSFDNILLGLVRLDAPTLWLSTNVRPCVKDAEGKIQLAVMSFSDVSEKRNLEEKFLRAQRLESIGILAGGVAHDLNNVLAPILLAIPIVRMRVSDSQGLMLLDTMEASATRGAQIVRQILTFTRGLRTQKVTMQARHLLKEIAELTQETFPRSISIETDLPRSLWQVEADTTQLHQVFMNLCVNARDAMPDGGTLSLTAENVELDEHQASGLNGALPGRYVRMTIGDTGTGISQELLKHIFEPFFTTKDPGLGTGLGLSTVRSIVEQHQGFLDVESSEGTGSRFHVFLPAVVTDEVEAPVLAKGLPHGHGETILVVDDEFALRHICESLLTAHDYQVISADSGQQAMALLRSRPEDIAMVITDLIMPRMSGAELIPLLRALKPALKIIAISGTIPTQGQDKAPAGVIADAFLNKPFAAEQLLLAVHEVLAERR